MMTAGGLAPVSWTPGLSCHRFLFAPPLERPRAEIAERRMPPPPVVEDLEVIEQLAARRRPRGPRRVVDELDLQRREETLGHGVVPAIAPAAHAAHDPVLGQDALVVAAGVLTAAIGMMEQPLRRGAGARGPPLPRPAEASPGAIQFFSSHRRSRAKTKHCTPD